MSQSVVFTPNRDAYIRSHVRLSAMAMAGAMAVLWLLDDPNIWVGAVAGLGAIGLRGWYLSSEELAVRWVMEDGALSGPGERHVPLSQIAQVRHMGSFVQIITTGGDKHLIKYQADPAATAAAIDAARA